MIAIISDIHSNLEAFTTVLEDIRSRDVEKIYCLGDIIGYGPDPREAVDLAMETCEAAIMGNHDYAILYEPTRFNIGAENAVFWTRDQLEREEDPELIGKRWRFLGKNDVTLELDGSAYGVEQLFLCHGSPRKPINEYLFSEDVHNNPTKLSAAMERFTGLCFVGHTHLPGVFTESLEFQSPDDLAGTFEFGEDHTKAIVNVGSVGQPRDRDSRSCYVTVEPGKVEFHRVEYDLQVTIDKLLNIPQLDDSLATRLSSGR